MDDRRAREVVEAKGFNPSLRRLARERAPHPVAAYRIDDSRHDHRVDEIALELDALRDRARYDRRGCRGEHRLEEEERPVPDSFAGRERRHPEASPAEPAPELRCAEHKRRAEDVESTSAKPACIVKTSMPAMRVQTTFRLVWTSGAAIADGSIWFFLFDFKDKGLTT